jgi:multiple sugar transport system substrate-binding protein
LRIAQWSAAAAGMARYDDWFDNDYTQRWGENHGVRVEVEHFRLAELSARAQAEVAGQSGHDIFGFTAPPPSFEDDVIDHREIVEEVEGKLGRMVPLVERSVRNPRTGKYFGFPEFWTPEPAHYRLDLWEQIGSGARPATWDDIRQAAARLKASGHPVGIALSEDPESTWSLLALMHAYGSALQRDDGTLAVNSPATVEAVKMATAIFRAGMSDDVFGWDTLSNNRELASGRSSFILNGISALRAIELQDPALAAKIGLLPTPGGPGGAGGTYLMGIYVVWRFSRNTDLARRFLVDLVLGYREAFIRSEFYKMPAFPGAVSDLAGLLAGDPRGQPAGKYGLLSGSATWSTNVGHPGHANAAVEEIVNRHLVPRMFARAARGDMSPEDSVAAAEAEMRPVFDKWREQGKI